MALIDDFNALKQAITDLQTRVTADIAALRAQLAAGSPITEQQLIDLTATVAAIDPAAPVPPPTPTP